MDAHTSDEFDLLDIAVAIAEWWRSFLIVPLAAAAVGYVAGIAVPVHYTATLHLPEVRGGVQASILRAAYSAPEVTVKLGRGDLTITARADTSSEAQEKVEIARSMIAGAAATWVKQERQAHIDYLDSLGSIDDTAFLATLTKATFDMTEIHAAEAFIEMARGNEAEIKKSGGKPALFAVFASLASLIALGASALVWSGLSASAKRPEGAEKIRRIKEALKLSKRA